MSSIYCLVCFCPLSISLPVSISTLYLFAFLYILAYLCPLWYSLLISVYSLSPGLSLSSLYLLACLCPLSISLPISVISLSLCLYLSPHSISLPVSTVFPLSIPLTWYQNKETWNKKHTYSSILFASLVFIRVIYRQITKINSETLTLYYLIGTVSQNCLPLFCLCEESNSSGLLKIIS